MSKPEVLLRTLENLARDMEGRAQDLRDLEHDIREFSRPEDALRLAERARQVVESGKRLCATLAQHEDFKAAVWVKFDSRTFEEDLYGLDAALKPVLAASRPAGPAQQRGAS